MAMVPAGEAPSEAALLGTTRLGDRAIEPVSDDRETLEAGAVVLLVVEDDPHYARVLVDLAHDHGMKACLVAIAARGRAGAGAGSICRPRFRWTCSCPTCWAGRCLASSSRTRLHDIFRCRWSLWMRIASTAWHAERSASSPSPRRPRGLRWRCRTSPTTRSRRKRLMVVEDNPAGLLSITELLGHDDIDIETVETGKHAIRRLREEPADCVVLDLRLPDMSGFEVLGEDPRRGKPVQRPVVVFTAVNCRPRRMRSSTPWPAAWS